MSGCYFVLSGSLYLGPSLSLDISLDIEREREREI